MSVHGTRLRPRAGRRLPVLAAGFALANAIAGCSSGPNDDDAAAPFGDDPGEQTSESATPEPVATVSTNLPERGTVSVIGRGATCGDPARRVAVSWVTDADSPAASRAAQTSVVHVAGTPATR